MLILTNLYGPDDNFKKETSHVIAALIRRFYEAKNNNEKEVTVWGNGNSTRDFCYIEDIATGIILAAENYNESEPVNLASGKEITIKEIATIIKKQINYEGKIIWDKDMPMGPNRRNVSIELARKKINFDPKPLLTPISAVKKSSPIKDLQASLIISYSLLSPSIIF